MDMRMPVMDGLEATRRIRALDGGRKTVILALTASAMEDNRQHAVESGVDDFLSKPCLEAELFQKTQQYLGLSFIFEDEETKDAEEVDVCRNLPQNVIAELRHAVGNGEKHVLDELIGKIGELDKRAARSLRQLADNYDYDALTQLLEEVGA
jgi:DNA-binding response OmpR family regulator